MQKNGVKLRSKPRDLDLICWAFREYFHASFSAFIGMCFSTLNKNSKLSFDWYIHLIADYLYLVYTKQIKRLIINIPPRCLKSISVSVAWPAWLLANDPNLKIILATYSQILTRKHFGDIESITSSDWYNSIFPEMEIKKSQKNKITTTDLGFIYSTSVGGTLTGEGGDILIIDDPHNPTHIHSNKLRKKVIDWYEQTFYSRLNNPNSGAIVVVMQRLHTDDLCGHLEKLGDWHILKIPIIADADYEYSTHRRVHEFNAGDIIDPKRFSPESINALKNNLGMNNFQAQYMQKPIPKQNLISSNMINYVSRGEINQMNFDVIIQSWDTAIKTSDTADFSVCTTFGVKDNQYYLIDIMRQKLEYPALKQELQTLNTKFKPYRIVIEDKASGQSLIQELKILDILNVIPVKPKLDKVTRMALNLEFFYSKKMYFVNDIPKEILEEILLFPYAKHDDVVDSISQFLDFVKIYLNSSSDDNFGKSNRKFFIQ